MYVWMAAVLPRLHWEERVFFPIYPMLCLGAAMTVGEVLPLTTGVMFLRMRNMRKDIVDVGCNGGKGQGGGDNNRHRSLLLGLAVLAPLAMISVSCLVALHRNYLAQLAIYCDLFYHASMSAAAAV